MAYKVIILYRLYMPSYFLGTFTEYPFLSFKNSETPSFVKSTKESLYLFLYFTGNLIYALLMPSSFKFCI